MDHVRLYRAVVGSPYTGPGSFWSPDPAVARAYGKRGGRLISTTATGRVLRLSADEDELTEVLELAGISNAHERVLMNDWLEDDGYQALRRFGYSWVVRYVDPSVSMQDVEWIYVGTKPLPWKAA